MNSLINGLDYFDNTIHNFLIRDPALKAGWIKLERPEKNTFYDFNLDKPPLLKSSFSDHAYAVIKIFLSPVSGVVGFAHGAVRCIVTAIAALWFLVQCDSYNAKHQGKHALNGVKRMVTSIGCAIPFFNLIGIKYASKNDQMNYLDALNAVQKMRSQQVFGPLLQETQNTPSYFANRFKTALNDSISHFVYAWSQAKGFYISVNTTTFFHKSPGDENFTSFPNGAHAYGYLGDQQNIGHLLKFLQTDIILMGQFQEILNIGLHEGFKILGHVPIIRSVTCDAPRIEVTLKNSPKTHRIGSIDVNFRTKLNARDLIYHKDSIEQIPYGKLEATISFRLKLDNQYLIDEVQDYKFTMENLTNF